MVSGIRDNPPLELPWPRKLSAYFFLQNPTNRSHEDREPFSGGETIRVGELSRETSSNKRFGSPDLDNSWRGEYHVMPTIRI